MTTYLVTGMTYEHRDKLKALGGKWSPELKGWIVSCGSTRLMHVLNFAPYNDKEARHDNLYNEGSEGYNPYR